MSENDAMMADEAIKRISGIIGAWKRTPTADRYPIEVTRQALALNDIALVLRDLELRIRSRAWPVPEGANVDRTDKPHS